MLLVNCQYASAMNIMLPHSSTGIYSSFPTLRRLEGYYRQDGPWRSGTMIPDHGYCIYWDTVPPLDAQITAPTKVLKLLVPDIGRLGFYSQRGSLGKYAGKMTSTVCIFPSLLISLRNTKGLLPLPLRMLPAALSASTTPPIACRADSATIAA